YRLCVRARGARGRRPLQLPRKYGEALPCGRDACLRGSNCAWAQTRGPPSEGGSFVAKMRTARCVAIQVVPSSSTTPSSSTAPIAAARWRGDSSDVTYSVALTRTNMAQRVNATMRTVTKEARIIFMRLDLGRHEAAWRRIAQPERKLHAEDDPLVEKQSWRALRDSA